MEITLPDIPFTTHQAATSWVNRKALTQLVREHTLVRVLMGVYMRADAELTTMTRAQAASLVVSRHSVVCDRTAAWIHGVGVFEYRELDLDPQLESYVLRGHDPTDRPECNGGTRDLRPEDWTWIGGLRVTTPLRTAMDLGCKLSRRRALAAMDALMRLHGFTHADMRRLLTRYFRRRGVVQFRQLMPLVDGRSESSGESWTRLEIHDRGLPVPEPQYWVLEHGVPKFRLDLAYPHARVAIEYNGREFHESEEARTRDEQRLAWLREHGWTVIVVDKDSFTDDAIAVWIAELRAALRLPG